MDSYKNIEQKLHQFTRKYYINELIKGGILFFSLGGLYFFFTLFLEYFLWLKPLARTLLFWLFVFVQLFLLIRFIAIPIFKLFGLRKGISLEQSSKIIGNHFPKVQDKLLNILQLKGNSNQTDLIIASIDQKVAELQPIPFVKAVDFKQNKRYLKYIIIPVLIWLTILFTGIDTEITQSLERVVNYNTAYNPPAPFLFSLESKDLRVVQGKSITVRVKTIGSVLPEEAKIVFNNEQYYLQDDKNGNFSYLFFGLQKTVTFFVTANGIRSKDYTINVIKTPTVDNITLQLKYPKYIGKADEVIKNTGNITVAEGTKITWKIQTNQTDSLAFISNQKRDFFKTVSTNKFTYSKRILNTLNYQIASSNKNLKDFEDLHFFIGVVKDEFPQISVTSNIDSVSRGTSEFAGQISDDYGLKKLQIVYYDVNHPKAQKTFDLNITKKTIQPFFYQFPTGLELKQGVNYELFFQVFDNDAVNGGKRTRSKIFNYRQKTNEEEQQELLQEQKNSINSLEKSIENQRTEQRELEKIQQNFETKKSLYWKDKKRVDNFVKSQRKYRKMMQRQAQNMQENLDEKKEENKNLQRKKEELKERLRELKKMEKQQRLLAEIEKISKKLNKENLLKKAKELTQQNRQQQRSLERILELTKRFYVEQKTMQIANKLSNLAKKQKKLSIKEENTVEAQKGIKKEFNNKLKKEMKNLANDNEKLKEPMEFPEMEKEKELINKELNNSEENLENQNKKKAQKNQQKASEKMKEMSIKMQKAMMKNNEEASEENIKGLRRILKNLLAFSFAQEDLMNKFSEISTSHPDFGKDLQKQNNLKTYFEKIDDSLYVLSMRLPRISDKIQDDLSSTHYNLNQSLENFSDNKFANGISNQRYVMTATNDLTDYLSNIFNAMKNSKSKKMGKGKGDGFSLPDLIKKQGELSEKMKKGLEEKAKKAAEKGDKKKKGEGNSRGDSDGKLYEIYKQQSLLREQFKKALKGKSKGDFATKKVLKTMEQLEDEILEKRFDQKTLQKMKRLNYQLLKLDKAILEQGEDEQRKSKTNQKKYDKNKAKPIRFKWLFYNQTEILNRQSLPLQQDFKKRVQEYFSKSPKK